ncbi:hypothetical protein KFL_001640210 [Klebsormidium nitens]|uniref:Dirigent protein n=1 Tax=Klebsormidium nitens TaxID=105231 RepID=A0A0U9HNW6_KLENI|nr:hypothetical protein KFL_001640210 [Klebsormidium nitens]|eukprot:GAQ83846.1 hypothetical protein KFL_001640210 [Klebsormidium nitens]
MGCSRAQIAATMCLVGALLTATSAVHAANSAWEEGPTFEISATAEAVNTFVGQVTPSGTNQLTGTVTMEERGYFPVDAQNQKVKDLTIVYGPVNPNDPVELGSYGPGNMTYVQDPSLEGAIVPGVTVQLKAKAGYHFVAVSFGVALSNFGRHTEAFFVDGLGSSTVGSGSITVDSLVLYSEGRFEATNIYTPQITIVPHGPAIRFVIDNVKYVLEPDS